MCLLLNSEIVGIKFLVLFVYCFNKSDFLCWLVGAWVINLLIALVFPSYFLSWKSLGVFDFCCRTGSGLKVCKCSGCPVSVCKFHAGICKIANNSISFIILDVVCCTWKHSHAIDSKKVLPLLKYRDCSVVCVNIQLRWGIQCCL